ncbi:CCA tRNA nucleotidyltransferase [Roseovarius spongiae]|uniref:CCA tRNA nucleotidyltransferase n=1 Tax=Roseovarius spongiae TaxID=2320272 RepID=A0A3A8ARC1_9RHOB|nr:CCA tRNA nucleotidyltransferase [Roseovarius spongiae]RKF13355.1 CCA tRNA nucleotidyltransferase [Roseovarius spongiae]
MKIGGDWLRAPHLQAVFALIDKGGHSAYLVGGAVRDAVLGRRVGDLDLATDATPQKVTALAKAAGIRCVPTGLDHGTVTLVIEGVPHEITTFRRDEETFGRHARVAFTTDMAEDARRRDFTMNALYADADGRVIDPLGGLPDALAGRVRFVEDAERRICEDYLRILRFFRFTAWFARDGIDAEGLAACAAHQDGLEKIAAERVGAEMTKLLAAPDPAPSVAAMRQSGVLARILPGADDRALAALVHHEGEAGVAPDWRRRLAALGGEGVAERLRLSNANARRLAVLREGVEAADGPGALGYRHGSDLALDILLLRAALLEAPLPAEALHEAARGARSQFPLSATDLMPALSGPALGAALRTLEDRWIASGFKLGRDELMKGAFE